MVRSKVNIEVGQQIEYKTHDGRGRPTRATVLALTPRTLTVARTTNSQILKIKAKDVIRLAEAGIKATEYVPKMQAKMPPVTEVATQPRQMRARRILTIK